MSDWLQPNPPHMAEPLNLNTHIYIYNITPI